MVSIIFMVSYIMKFYLFTVLIIYAASVCDGLNNPSTRSVYGPINFPKPVSQAAALLGATLLGFSLSVIDFRWEYGSESTQYMDIDVFRPNMGKYHPRFARISGDHRFLFIEAAHADSTGKMSTKLTARKRYLPRIKEGVSKFNALSSDKAISEEFFKGSRDQARGRQLYASHGLIWCLFTRRRDTRQNIPGSRTAY